MRFVQATCLALMIALNFACAAMPGGGIVDNGNKPRKPHPDDPAAGDAQPVPQSLPDGERAGLDRAVVILGAYEVVLPTSGWTVEGDAGTVGATYLKNLDQMLVFSLGSLLCDVTPTINAHGFALYPCSTTQTILVNEDDTLVADHSARTAEIEQILASFRRINP